MTTYIHTFNKNLIITHPLKNNTYSGIQVYHLCIGVFNVKHSICSKPNSTTVQLYTLPLTF